jgi:hypothetical protein
LWRGWTVRSGCLYSPEGWEIRRADVLSSPLLRQQLAAYKSELRRLRESHEVLIQDQPTPDQWPQWLSELSA